MDNFFDSLVQGTTLNRQRLEGVAISAEAQALVAIGQIMLARAIHDGVGGTDKNRFTAEHPRYRGYNGYNK